jgi:hypothetical protein
MSGIKNTVKSNTKSVFLEDNEITLDEAHKLLKNMARIRLYNGGDSIITDAFKANDEAIRYYSGKRQGYVFSYDALKKLLEGLGEENYVVFFEASKEHLKDEVEVHKGRPTLIGFAYRGIEEDEEFRLELVPDKKGLQHPPIADVSLDDLNINGIPMNITEFQKMIK